MEALQDEVEGGMTSLAGDPELRQALKDAAKCQRAFAKADVAWQAAMSGFITSMAAPGSTAVDVRKAMAIAEYPDLHRQHLEAKAESRVANQHVVALLILRGRPAIHLLDGVTDYGEGV